MSSSLVKLATVMAVLVLAAPVLSATQHDLRSTPEARAAALKQHVERWLHVHRPDLSHNGEALVREFIDSITPDLYTAPPTRAASEQQSLLAHRLACALGGDRAATLTRLDIPPQRISRTWGEGTRDWIDWLVNCVGQ